MVFFSFFHKKCRFPTPNTINKIERGYDFFWNFLFIKLFFRKKINYSKLYIVLKEIETKPFFNL